MRSSFCLALVVALCCMAPLVSAGSYLHPERVHCIEYNATYGNFLFRSSIPTNDTTMAYDELVAIMRNRSIEECGVELPVHFQLQIFSLNNDVDGCHSEFLMEQKFMKDNPQLGSLTDWLMGTSGLLPPSVFSKEEVKKMSKSDVWKIDELPKRLTYVHDEVVHSPQPMPAVALVHCCAGCDRTGEFIGSYRLRYLNQNITDMYSKDCSECGRCPNYWGTTAIEWACYWMSYYVFDRDIGDCENFADCKMFGSCTQP
jgi:hypothetical protein